jgi:hypothetical protein
MNQLTARPGDHIVIVGHRVGDVVREGEILESRGLQHGPPFLVRWSDGHRALFWPGSDARIRRQGAIAHAAR